MGRYIVSRLDVLLMMHLFTMEANSTSRSSAIFTSLSEAEASLPRKIGFSKRRLNSEVVPRYMYSYMYMSKGIVKYELMGGVSGCGQEDTPSIPVFTKCNKLKYSNRSFCIGVPDKRILF